MDAHRSLDMPSPQVHPLLTHSHSFRITNCTRVDIFFFYWAINSISTLLFSRLGLTGGGGALPLRRYSTFRALSDESHELPPEEEFVEDVSVAIPEKRTRVKAERKTLPKTVSADGAEKKLKAAKKVATFDQMSMDDFLELWIRLCENDVEYNEMKVRKRIMQFGSFYFYDGRSSSV